MEMHQVRYFLAAAAALSFTRAAEECHVSQPALTAAMKKLEAELGGALFFREANRLKLTEFGRQMQPLLAQVRERADAVQSAAESRRLLNPPPARVGVMPSLGPARMVRFLLEFARVHPGIEVAIREGRPAELAKWLDADELDVALLNPVDAVNPSFRADPLYTERYVVLLPPAHALADREGLTLRELHRQPYVDRLACEMRERVMTVCGQMKVELYARFRSEREDWVQAMVAAGLGFAFMPEHAISQPAVVQRPLTEPAVERTIVLATMPGRAQSQGVATFVRAARAYRWHE